MWLNIESVRNSVRQVLMPNNMSFLGLKRVPGNPVGGGRVLDEVGHSERLLDAGHCRMRISVLDDVEAISSTKVDASLLSHRPVTEVDTFLTSTLSVLVSTSLSKAVEVVPIPLHPIIQFSFMFIVYQ